MTADELNPAMMFQTTATDLLAKMLSGEIDPVALARRELRSRGLDDTGKWIGPAAYAEAAGDAR